MRKRVVITIICLVLLCFAMITNPDEIKAIFANLFRENIIHKIVWSFIAISVICNLIFSPKSSENDLIKLGDNNLYFFEALLNLITLIGIASTSLTLLKGVYLQSLYNEIYFINFGEYDIGIMGVVSCFLLWFALVKSWNQLSEAVFYTSAQNVTVAKNKRN